ncbi:MAG: transcription antitermination factor NusB [Candidatus Poribacteria bacterium]|nr:transcription antitermination factor NusB [Candidatus Poribacteria bacterium]
MPSRRQSRIVAMQMLYQIHLTAEPIQLVMEKFWQSQDISTELRPFALQLVEGTTSNLETIDAELQATAKNWRLHRMPIVDLSILRIATYEILYIDEIDAATSINEAVEIAKSYSTPNSPKFINGVLDNIRKKHEEMQ